MLGRGAKYTRISEDREGFSARLLRISAGKPMPRHGHSGMEMTLVLNGGYWGEAGSYQRGDIAEHDECVEHRPVADSDKDCICLVVANAPVQLRGIIGRLFRPLLGMSGKYEAVSAFLNMHEAVMISGEIIRNVFAKV